MLGSADVGAGALTQTNPKPMVFRIIDNGILPNGYQSHLKDCLVTAAVVGDISSERGNIRLERLSCVNKSKEVFEQVVEGTIFGHDGKNGVRGRPVWREGPLLLRSGFAGLLSGIGSGVERKFTPQAALATEPNQLPSTEQIVGQGVGSGVHDAFSQLADYHIRRAELYHPVIQINAGQAVDIVFLKGFSLENKSPEVKQKPKQSFIEKIKEKGAFSL